MSIRIRSPSDGLESLAYLSTFNCFPRPFVAREHKLPKLSGSLRPRKYICCEISLALGLVVQVAEF